MKTIFYYGEEQRELEFNTDDIIMKYELVNGIGLDKVFELKNLFVSLYGLKLKVLIPINDEVLKLTKVELYDNNILITEITNIKDFNYKIFTDFSRSPLENMNNQCLIENIRVRF